MIHRYYPAYQYIQMFKDMIDHFASCSSFVFLLCSIKIVSIMIK